jgi:hypothetical protein
MIKLIKKIIIVLIFIIIIYLFLVLTDNRDEYGEIYEIDNTRYIQGIKSQKMIDAQIHVMILKPPKSLYELKSVIEEYTNKYIFDEEEIEKEINSVNFSINEIYYQIYFYRESEKLPYDWQPKKGFFGRDRLEFHKDDLIASVKWTDIDPEKKYNCMKKSTKKDNYGYPISEIFFIEDIEVDRLYE